MVFTSHHDHAMYVLYSTAGVSFLYVYIPFFFLCLTMRQLGPSEDFHFILLRATDRCERRSLRRKNQYTVGEGQVKEGSNRGFFPRIGILLTMNIALSVSQQIAFSFTWRTSQLASGPTCFTLCRSLSTIRRSWSSRSG